MTAPAIKYPSKAKTLTAVRVILWYNMLNNMRGSMETFRCLSRTLHALVDDAPFVLALPASAGKNAPTERQINTALEVLNWYAYKAPNANLQPLDRYSDTIHVIEVEQTNPGRVDPTGMVIDLMVALKSSLKAR